MVRAASEIDLYHVASGSKHGARPEVRRVSKAAVKKQSNGKMQKRVEAGTARSEATITRFFQTINQRVNVAGQNEDVLPAATTVSGIEESPPLVDTQRQR